MLRLTLTDADRVLICARVERDRRQTIVAGSIITRCAECDAEIWRAPGPPIASLDVASRVIQLRTPLGIQVEPITVLLCWLCAEAHMIAGY